MGWLIWFFLKISDWIKNHRKQKAEEKPWFFEKWEGAATARLGAQNSGIWGHPVQARQQQQPPARQVQPDQPAGSRKQKPPPGSGKSQTRTCRQSCQRTNSSRANSGKVEKVAQIHIFHWWLGLAVPNFINKIIVHEVFLTSDHWFLLNLWKLMPKNINETKSCVISPFLSNRYF